MSVRILSTILGAVTAAAFLVPAAEARVPRDALAGHQAAAARPSLALNTKHRALRRQASLRAEANDYAVRKKRRYTSKKARRAKHAHTHSRSGGSGGTSRSCLQASARALLDRIESRFGPVRIVSTCRPGAVIATSGKPSKHRNGLAIDFDAGSRKAEIVRWLIANHHSGGTMTYRDMSHIHVDVGQRFVSLGSHSGRG